MEDEPIAKLEDEFRKVERDLDAMLAAARAELSALGVELRDESNRTGFDWHGPDFVWSCTIDKVQVSADWHRRVLVEITYRQPWESVPCREVKITTRAEVFQTARDSVFRHDAAEKLSLESLRDRGLAEVVTKALNGGMKVLDAQPYGK
jgi:hypothetical protein